MAKAVYKVMEKNVYVGMPTFKSIKVFYCSKIFQRIIKRKLRTALLKLKIPHPTPSLLKTGSHAAAPSNSQPSFCLCLRDGLQMWAAVLLSISKVYQGQGIWKHQRFSNRHIVRPCVDFPDQVSKNRTAPKPLHVIHRANASVATCSFSWRPWPSYCRKSFSWSHPRTWNTG